MSLPLISSKELCAALTRLGFVSAHGDSATSGSHDVWVSDDGRACTVTLGKNPVARGTLRSILRQASLSEDDLRLALGGKHARSVKNEPPQPPGP